MSTVFIFLSSFLAFSIALESSQQPTNQDGHPDRFALAFAEKVPIEFDNQGDSCNDKLEVSFLQRKAIPRGIANTTRIAVPRKALQKRCLTRQGTYVSDPSCANSGGFLITGVGRTGTNFLAHWLWKLGVKVSHDDDEERGEDGAVSWIHGFRSKACNLPNWTYPIRRPFGAAYLLLREPLSQIASRSGNGEGVWPPWESDDFWADTARCGVQMEPMVSQREDAVNWSLETALKHYVLQNSYVERYAKGAFRFEDVIEDPRIVMALCKRYGGASARCSKRKVLEVFHDMEGTNHTNEAHTEKTSGVTWKRLVDLDRGFAAMAQNLAQRHGYKLPRQEVLPEAAFGYKCDWNDAGLWACTLARQARTLLQQKFKLSNLIRAKDADRFCGPLPKLNKNSVVSLAVAQAGSQMVAKSLKASGQPEIHEHSCTWAFVADSGAGHVIIPLENPISRLISGYQRFIKLAADESEDDFFSSGYLVTRSDDDDSSEKAVDFLGQFPNLNDFVNALRDTKDEKHVWAIDVAYRPSSHMYLLPIVEFYLGGVASPNSKHVSFVCLCRLDKDIARIGRKLGHSLLDLNVSITHASDKGSSNVDLHKAKLSKENEAWLRKIYAKDFTLYSNHCGRSCD